jgi:iron complex transport system ATP-binding protein
VTEDIILSHKMDSIFTHKNIRFDYDHGVYYPAVSGTKEISVESNDETLLHWAINALNRNGYICYPGAQSHDDIPHLTVSAATQLTLTKAANATEYTSFAALLSNLD